MKTSQGKLISFEKYADFKRWYVPCDVIKLIQYANHKLDTYAKNPSEVLCHKVSSLWNSKTGASYSTIIKACTSITETVESKKNEVWGTEKLTSKGKKNNAESDINGHAHTMLDWYGIPVFNVKGKLVTSDKLTEFFYNDFLVECANNYMAE